MDETMLIQVQRHTTFGRQVAESAPQVLVRAGLPVLLDTQPNTIASTSYRTVLGQMDPTAWPDQMPMVLTRWAESPRVQGTARSECRWCDGG
jgi:hypothetical protein